MFGNLRGWISSGVIVLVTIGLLYLLHLSASQADPPGRIGQLAAQQTLALPIAPTTVAKYMTEPRDAGELYRQAIADFVANQAQYEKFFNNAKDYMTTAPGKALPAPQFKGVELVLQGRTANTATIFASDLAGLINYGYDIDNGPIKHLNNVGETTLRMGLLHERFKRRKEAKEHYEAAFSLGVKLFDERIIWQEADAGLIVLSGAARKLKDMAEEDKDTETARAWGEFLQAKNDFYTLKVMKGVYPAIFNLNNPQAGDMIALAQFAGDRTWRVEATLGVGRCKFQADGRGNQIGARRFLKSFVNDTTQDPTVQFAAKVARDCKVEDIRMLGK